MNAPLHIVSMGVINNIVDQPGDEMYASDHDGTFRNALIASVIITVKVRRVKLVFPVSCVLLSHNFDTDNKHE